MDGTTSGQLTRSTTDSSPEKKFRAAKDQLEIGDWELEYKVWLSVRAPVPISDAKVALAGPDRAPAVPVRFEVIVFHRGTELMIVALLPGGEDPSNNAPGVASAAPGQIRGHFERVVASLMRGILGGSSAGAWANEFWRQAMETQIASRPTPTSNKVLAALPRCCVQPLEPILGERCTICQADYEVGDCVARLPCKHSFHQNCLVPWLKQKNTCPLCRFPLRTQDEELQLTSVENKAEVSEAAGPQENDAKSTWSSRESSPAFSPVPATFPPRVSFSPPAFRVHPMADAPAAAGPRFGHDTKRPALRVESAVAPPLPQTSRRNQSWILPPPFQQHRTPSPATRARTGPRGGRRQELQRPEGQSCCTIA